MRLTDVKIRNAKPSEKVVKLSDGDGLQLWISPAGGKVWRFAYRHAGKQKSVVFGPYPAVSLNAARARRMDARKQLAEGQDPAVVKQLRKVEIATANANTFTIVAAELLAKKKREGKASATIGKREWLYSLAGDWIGSRPVNEITPPEILAILQDAERKGMLETARRLRSSIGEVFRFAIATGRATSDPTRDLRGAVAAPKVKHRSAIVEPKAFGGLLRAIADFTGQKATKSALQLMAYLFPRPGELRAALWSEFDTDGAMWTIPAERTKMRREHRVPLPRQALEVLEGLRPYTGHAALVFPGLQSPRKPLSENTMNSALRRLGYGPEEHVAHGFRASARTIIDEAGVFGPHIIEAALGHQKKDAVERAYARATYLEERTKLMQWWANHCDALRDGAKVIPIGRAG